MGSYFIGYLVTVSALPIVLASILWLARQDMRRTLTVLSALALGLGLADASVYSLTLKMLVEGQGAYSYTPIGASNLNVYIAILPALEQGHAFALAVASMLQIAAWVLALYHAVQTRRGRWLTVIAACAAFSTFVAFFASNVSLIGVIATNPQLNGPIATHPYGMLFAVNALSSLAAAATLLYAQVGLRTSKASSLVPGAVVMPADGIGALPTFPTLPDSAMGTEEDVEFIVERLPDAWSERR